MRKYNAIGSVIYLYAILFAIFYPHTACQAVELGHSKKFKDKDMIEISVISFIKGINNGDTLQAKIYSSDSSSSKEMAYRHPIKDVRDIIKEGKKIIISYDNTGVKFVNDSLAKFECDMQVGGSKNRWREIIYLEKRDNRWKIVGFDNLGHSISSDIPADPFREKNP